MAYSVYILYSAACDRYYVGHLDSIDRRLIEHNSGRGGKYTSSCAPWTLVYQEDYLERSEAVRREMEIKKKKSRKYIEWLVKGRPG